LAAANLQTVVEPPALLLDKPFGTNLENGTTVYHIDAYGCYALVDLNNGATVIARWTDGLVCSFTNEYGKGRVFYQAEMNWLKKCF
jgi:hypothetical protein